MRAAAGGAGRKAGVSRRCAAALLAHPLYGALLLALAHNWAITGLQVQCQRAPLLLPANQHATSCPPGGQALTLAAARQVLSVGEACPAVEQLIVIAPHPAVVGSWWSKAVDPGSGARRSSAVPASCRLVLNYQHRGPGCLPARTSSWQDISPRRICR